ncbi:MAG: hypothetical protein NVSMB6_22170 [Burkholderiaceae bacterium]
MLFPNVVAGQVDMVSVYRRNVLEQLIINGISLIVHRADCPLQVDGVPQDNRCHDQIEATDMMTLQFVDAIPNFAMPVKYTARAKVFFASSLFNPAVTR